MPIDIGKLNKRITIQRKVQKKDEMGQDKLVWEDWKTLWATVKPMKSTEYKFIEKLAPEVTHRIYIRYLPGVTADMRIIYHGRTLNISSPPVDIDERHEILEIQAEEVFEGELYQPGC